MCARKRSTVEEGGQLRFFSHHAHASMRTEGCNCDSRRNGKQHTLTTWKHAKGEAMRTSDGCPDAAGSALSMSNLSFFKRFAPPAPEAWGISLEELRRLRVGSGELSPATLAVLAAAPLSGGRSWRRPRSSHIGAGCGYAGRCLRPRSPCTSVY